MRNMKMLNLYVLVITATLIFIPIASLLVFASETVIHVEPAETTIEGIGQTFEINITISQVNDLAGWDFKLYYRNAILNATNIVEGPFLKTANDTFFLNKTLTDNYNATHGLVWAACTLIGTGSGASGNGTLTTITFKATSFGFGLLHLAETDLIDSQMPPNHIVHTTQDGLILSGVSDIAVTSVTPSKTVMGQGYSQLVNVTVENQGNYFVTFNVTLEALRPNVSVVNIHLFGSNVSGWGFTSDNVTSPGPTITIKKGDIVNLTLTSLDAITHNFFVDYNGDTSPSPGEPKSPDFPNPLNPLLTINYQFTADKFGTFKYYCQYNKATMNGTFIAEATPMIPTQIGKQSVSLNSGMSANLTFTWNTLGFAKINYTISAYALPVSGEIDTADNTYTDGAVLVTIPGDVNGDRKVDGKDIAVMSKYFGARTGQPGYVPNADINCDGKIDGKDIAIASKNFGQRDP